MSLITKQDRISVRQFAAVPALVGLPEITRSARFLSTSIELEEGCMVTKLVKYTHRVGDPGDVVRNIIKDLAIVPFTNFTLDKPCNLAFLESYIHTSLDVYALIAITPSLSTLDSLIQMSQMDKTGHICFRKLDFTAQCYVDPEYELVALHPEHFLPNSPLVVYDPVTQGHKLYVVAQDRCLRESTDPNSNPFPPFHHRAKARGRDLHPNVFLVALNAEIKFRRYLKMVRASAPPHLSQIMSLLLCIGQSSSLISFTGGPVSTKGSSGSEEQRMDKDDEDSPAPSDSWARSRLERHELRPTSIWPEDMDLAARKARGMALMSGHDPVFDSDDAYGMMDVGTDTNVTAWIDEN
ncbi:hypothetical protein BGW80DRAFT_1357980 [Lactifluus volemus]|nr:hypothetical protein BGW80DRAFT_1357980 [Lactifluus volemus]